MTTSSERAVLEAARAVFRVNSMRDRIERMGTLHRAVTAYEVELNAAAIGAPTLEDRFLEALSRVPGPAGVRAYNAYKRYWSSLESLAGASNAEIAAARSTGPAVAAAWAAALTSVGLTVKWLGIVDFQRYTEHLEAVRASA